MAVAPPESAPTARAAHASPNRQRDLDARGRAPRSIALPHTLASLTVTPLAPGSLRAKLRIGSPDDAYEQEADRVADQVVQRMELAPGQPSELGSNGDGGAGGPDVYTSQAGEGDVQRTCATCDGAAKTTDVEEETVQRKCAASSAGGTTCPACAAEAITPLAEERAVQPKLDGDFSEEEEEEEGIDGGEEQAVQRAVLPGSGEGDDDDDGATLVQAKSAGPSPRAQHASFTASLRAAEGGGSSLGRDVRPSVERASGFDFGGVRIHTDSAAAQLASSINAVAFTRGSHIYFGSGAYRPETKDGTHLLAHELTHVLQQSRGAMTGAVQRAPGPKRRAPKRRYVGELGIFGDDASTPVVTVPLFMTESATRVGTYTAAMDRSGKVTFTVGASRFVITLNGPDAKALVQDAIEKHRKFRVRIIAIGPATGGTKQTTWDLGQGGAEKREGTEQGSGGQPGGKGTKPGEGKEGASSEGGESTRKAGPPGSKYGVFGFLTLPPWAIKALETALEAFGNSEEYLALAETLRTLKNLVENRDKLSETFSNTDKLLDVALGLEENRAVDTLRDWAMAQPKRKTTKPRARRGIMRLAQKVAALVARVRKVLRPVFTAREKFIAVFQGVLGLITSLPSVEQLFDLGSDIGGHARDVVQKTLGNVSKELGASIQEKLLAARKSFALAKEKFLEKDLITPKEVADAVVAAFKKMVKGPYKLIVIAAEQTQLDTVLAEQLVAPLIDPKDLEGVNGAIRKLGEQVGAIAEPVMRDLERVLTGIADELAAELPAQIESAFVQTSQKGGASAAPGLRSTAYAERSMRSSSAQPLPEKMRDTMETGIGFRFADVRIHADRPAAAAADALGANALTMGRHVFFGDGKYNPDTKDGQRLLAHELTHVVQQSDLPDSNLVQGDWKDVRKRVIAKFGLKVKEALKIGSGGDPKTLATAKAAREWVANRIKSNPDLAPGTKLPEPYDFVKKGGTITGIRRKTKYLRLVPGLALDKGKVRAGSIGKLRLGILGKLGVYDVHPEIVFDKARFPNIAPHIKDAQNRGRPKVLHRVESKAVSDRNRRIACGKIHCGTGLTCDEYPFATSQEGGTNALTKCVPEPEHPGRQGGVLGSFYSKYGIRDKDPFRVKAIA